jgi:hypothetical protein
MLGACFGGWGVLGRTEGNQDRINYFSTLCNSFSPKCYLHQSAQSHSILHAPYNILLPIVAYAGLPKDAIVCTSGLAKRVLRGRCPSKWHTARSMWKMLSFAELCLALLSFAWLCLALLGLALFLICSVALGGSTRGRELEEPPGEVSIAGSLRRIIRTLQSRAQSGNHVCTLGIIPLSNHCLERSAQR